MDRCSKPLDSTIITILNSEVHDNYNANLCMTTCVLQTYRTRSCSSQLDSIIITILNSEVHDDFHANLCMTTCVLQTCRCMRTCSSQLDSIITVVDSININRQLREQRADEAVNEAQVQVAYADLVLLNKVCGWVCGRGWGLGVWVGM